MDASSIGLGMALLQPKECEELETVYGHCLQPVVYTPTSHGLEHSYNSSKNELLTIVSGLEHFNHYIYGRHVTVITDNKIYF